MYIYSQYSPIAHFIKPYLHRFSVSVNWLSVRFNEMDCTVYIVQCTYLTYLFNYLPTYLPIYRHCMYLYSQYSPTY